MTFSDSYTDQWNFDACNNSMRISSLLLPSGIPTRKITSRMGGRRELERGFLDIINSGELSVRVQTPYLSTSDIAIAEVPENELPTQL